MKSNIVVLLTPETYEDFLSIQKNFPNAKKYGDVAMESVGTQGHLWDRYAYALPFDAGFKETTDHTQGEN